VGLSLWRDIAIVWLALLCFIGMVLPLVVAVFAVKGMHIAVERTPRLLRQAQVYTRALRTHVDAASYRVADPVIQAQRQSTKISTLLDRLWRRTEPPFSKGENRR
jgi:hypothetical protein